MGAYHTMASEFENLDVTDPDIGEVSQTLRFLSQASKAIASRRNAVLQRCSKCCGVIQKRKTREEILKNLGDLEKKLAAAGRQLPPWVQSYKNGDPVRAAKLLHHEYVRNNRKNISSEAIMTLESPQNAEEVIANRMEMENDIERAR